LGAVKNLLCAHNQIKLSAFGCPRSEIAATLAVCRALAAIAAARL